MSLGIHRRPLEDFPKIKTDRTSTEARNAAAAAAAKGQGCKDSAWFKIIGDSEKHEAKLAARYSQETW